MIKFEDVKVLVEGSREKVDDGFEMSSSVILVKGDKNILIDTGTFADSDELLNAFKEEGLTPDDINIILLTHPHIDHVANISLFRKAEVYYRHKLPPAIVRLKTDSHLISVFKEDELDFGGVKFISTPGHTQGHVSIVIDTDKGKIVVSGDAITNERWADLKNKMESKHNCDPEGWEKSRKKILQIADYIIPGHGPMFKVKK